MQFIVAWNFFFLASQIFHRICCKTQVSPKNNQYWFDVKAKRWDRASGGNGNKIFPATYVSGELKNRSEIPLSLSKNLSILLALLKNYFHCFICLSLARSPPLFATANSIFIIVLFFYSLNPKCHFICFNVIAKPVTRHERPGWKNEIAFSKVVKSFTFKWTRVEKIFYIFISR